MAMTSYKNTLFFAASKETPYNLTLHVSKHFPSPLFLSEGNVTSIESSGVSPDMPLCMWLSWPKISANGNLILAFFILLLPILTHYISSWRFRRNSDARDQNVLIAPPVIPYWNILLGHLFDLAWNTRGFLEKAVQLARQSPVEVKAGVIDFTVVSNPRQIQKVFLSCKKLSNKHMAVVALQQLFGASKEVAELFEDGQFVDVPAVGTHDETTAQGEAQLKDHVSGFGAYARTFLSGPYLKSVSQQFMANLAHHTESLDIKDDWVEFPDLYSFLQGIVSRATIEALMGSKIFEINPEIVQDFWTFERGTPKFIRCCPRWLMPTQYKARDRIFETLKELDHLASQNLSRLEPTHPDWEPYLGSKFLRARHEYGMFLNPLPDDTKAWEKMGIMFGANSNLLPSMFWYIFEVLKDPKLRDRMSAEVMSCLPTENPEVGHHLESLSQQPLLQSAYAETLRMRVAIALPRTCERGDFELYGHKIKKDKHILIFTSPVMQDDAAWTRAGKPPLRPFEKFWADRFLAPKNASQHKTGDEEMKDLEFSLRGLAGRWMPFGGGQHLCPGRHYAKRQIIGSFSFFFANYELELLDEAGSSKVEPDMRWFPSGSLPPNRQVPFRIRRRR